MNLRSFLDVNAAAEADSGFIYVFLQTLASRDLLHGDKNSEQKWRGHLRALIFFFYLFKHFSDINKNLLKQIFDLFLLEYFRRFCIIIAR